MEHIQDQDIVLFASAPWRTTGRLNCHHIATRLAERNRVLYVEPPPMRKVRLSSPTDLRKLMDRLKRWTGGAAEAAAEVPQGMTIFSPRCLPIRGQGVWSRWLAGRLARSVAKRGQAMGMSRPILWAFLPIAEPMVAAVAPRLTVYHCVDDYAGNAGVDAEAVGWWQRRMLSRADIALATSQPLADRLRSEGGRDVHCMPNVAEVERFAGEAPAEPADLAAIPRPRVGYFGNLAGYKVDLGLLEELAGLRPGLHLVLVGPVGAGDPTTDISRLARHKNVHILGEKPYDLAPAYVNGFDVCLIPFRRGRVSDGSLPLKTFEYLAAGRPVVARPIEALTREPLDEVVAFADSAEAFAAAVDAALAEDMQTRRRARQDVAGRYSWAERFPQIEACICRILNPKQPTRR